MDMNLCQLVQHYFVSRGHWQDTEGMAKISGGCALLAPLEWQLGGMWETHSCTWLPSCVCLPSPVSFPSVQWRLSVHSSDPQYPWDSIQHTCPHGTSSGTFLLFISQAYGTQQAISCGPAWPTAVSSGSNYDLSKVWTVTLGGGTLFQVCSFFRLFPWPLK